jgi:hypothetical protein
LQHRTGDRLDHLLSFGNMFGPSSAQVGLSAH